MGGATAWRVVCGIAIVVIAAGIGCGSAEPDLGPGALAGEISAGGGVACGADPDDCVGTVFVYVVAENPTVNPMQTPEAMTTVIDADLRGSGSVSYSIPEVPEGTWWLAVFQDDDGNASWTLPVPDSGDPIPFPFPQFTIRGEQTTTQNVTLAVRTP